MALSGKYLSQNSTLEYRYIVTTNFVVFAHKQLQRNFSKCAIRPGPDIYSG